MKNRTLVVLKPFYMLEAGDILELNASGKEYVASYDEQMTNGIDDGAEIYGNYSSTFTISAEYADELIRDGYLGTEKEDKKDPKFVNVFNEIDALLGKYTNELDNIDEDYANMPQCMKVEKTTVLNNMITVLNHLKNLKK